MSREGIVGNEYWPLFRDGSFKGNTNLITNFYSDKRKAFAGAIKKYSSVYPSVNLLIRETAYDTKGNVLKNMHAILCDSEDVHRREFYDMVDEVERELILSSSELNVCVECGCVEWSNGICESCRSSTGTLLPIIEGDLEVKTRNNRSERKVVFYIGNKLVK